MICLLRHASTEWNEAGRIQGRADPPLSPGGRREVATWSLPERWRLAACRTSPLRRARETAALLGLSAVIEPRLIEMAWGSCEGRTLAELRADPDRAFIGQEERGLDFEPPGGETPRTVMRRLGLLFDELQTIGGDHLLVTHKGVQRAALALATGWPMLGRPPLRLDGAALLLTLGSGPGDHAATVLPLAQAAA